MGTQVWMAENIDFGDKIPAGEYQSDATSQIAQKHCFDESQIRCDEFGGMYQWNTAMAMPFSCNTALSGSGDCVINSPHQGICPSGWHLASKKEWLQLINWTDSIVQVKGWTEPASYYLKDSTTWEAQYTGVDSLGFAAQAGGIRTEINFQDQGILGFWWSVDEISSPIAVATNLYNALDTLDVSMGFKTDNAMSVRCLHDE